MKIQNKSTFSLSSLISWIAFSTAMILIVMLLSVIQYEGRMSALESTETLFEEITTKTSARINVVISSIATLTETAALNPMTAALDHTDPASFIDSTITMKAILDDTPVLLSIYTGYNDGTFHQLIAPRNNETILRTYDAPPETAYIDRVITTSIEGTRHQVWQFRKHNLDIIRTRQDSVVEYDPRIRPWFVQAQETGQTTFTTPYIFSSSRLPGLTCARQLANGSGVLGVDVTLVKLGDILASQKVARNGVIWIVDKDNQLIALPGLAWKNVLSTDLHLPHATTSSNPVVAAVAKEMTSKNDNVTKGSRKPFFLNIDGEMYIASQMSMEPDSGQHLHVVIAAPLRDITGHIKRLAIRIVFIAVGLLIIIIPIVMLVGRRAARPVNALMAEAQKIQSFDFSPSPPINSIIKEVNTLAQTYEAMKATIRTKTENLIQTQSKLEMLVEGGVALSTEKKLNQLVSLIFSNAKELVQADGGVLYIKEDNLLGVELLSLGPQNIHLGGMSETPAPRMMIQPQIMAFLSKDSVLHSACQAFTQRESIVIPNGNFSLFPTGLPEEPKDYTISSLMCVPIVTRRDEVLGVIQLFNPCTETDTTEDGTCKERIKFVASLAAQAAVTLDNRNLVNSLTELFDALVQVVAASIDAKSPYTGGHCTRVPELAEMLARAAHEKEDGPLADFRLNTEDEWRQLFIASWLHDCGKVTTPEYVVDKATKLETIYNRIHEIRMRFEVLRRDAEIVFLQRQLQGKENIEQLEQELQETLRSIEDDFEFIANCNLGTEFMTEETQSRLESIANRTWMRHFSDRLGISRAEHRAKGDSTDPPLPVAEPLLSDKPEHIVPQSKNYSHLHDAFGNPLEIPPHEYNRGELYNLCISRGTLTPEERFKINEHTLSGLEMLSKIPFPENLRNVPNIALAHHETLIGTGYPLKKSAKDLRIESRILAIADIFEALTAFDRPYKKPKTLSEALQIMSFMRNDQHIDAELFDIFLKSGIFREYAQKYLRPEQNDTDDISPFLNNAHKRPGKPN
ncbi:HD domain-containing phosphohydrolase [Desulfovibrio inopinatus]|uniref:HD domain-containing phosphohydrolase n=1 Tax=Desulfovibrio inopinatus TaxID=102109 RepID=UPI0004082A13|nr:HD domain-containing phosphohydrolase [Desulfovibrio inopinatus]